MSLQDRSRTLSRPSEGNNSLGGKKLRKLGTDGEETDEEDTEENTLAAVPSITRLLNRKKLQISKPQRASETPAPPTLPEPAVESDLTGEVSTSSLERSLVDPASVPAAPPAAPRAPGPVPKAISVARRNASQPLITWELRQLARAKDPLGAGLVTLFNKGATSALFLSITPPSGRDVPLFCGTAASGEASRTPIWTGMRWDPAVTPALWNFFVKTGHLELPPPGSGTNEFSHRNTLRAAFGVRPDEFLLLLRAGPLEACRGILAVLSPRSLQDVLPAVLNTLAQSLPKKAA